MSLTLILGPMKSGKSFELISYFAPLKYTSIPFALFQSDRNVRDEHIHSRNGVHIEAQKVPSLKCALDQKYTVIGIDEGHMFPSSDVEVIEELLKRGTKVIISSLDMDHQGRLFEIIKKLLELGPQEVKYKRSVCEECKNPVAVYTQVLRGGIPVSGDLPSVLPEDGTFEYRPVCRNCFV